MAQKRQIESNRDIERIIKINKKSFKNKIYTHMLKLPLFIMILLSFQNSLKTFWILNKTQQYVKQQQNYY